MLKTRIFFFQMNKMKFECLPNETLIEFFHYLSSVDIFYSFDQLNHRFSKLIRALRLHLDFRHVPKSIFDRFCQQIHSDLHIQTQIHALYLSNHHTPGQIQTFLCQFSLRIFLNLQFLSLTEVRIHNINKLQSIPQLTFLHLESTSYDNEIISALQLSQLRKLSLSNQTLEFRINKYVLSLTHLTISSYSLYDLYHVIKSLPNLRYLNARISTTFSNRRLTNDLDHHSCIHLKTLILNHSNYDFHQFEIFFQIIPNLRHLTIIHNQNSIDIDQCQQLIINSFNQLKTFQFIFIVKTMNNDCTIQHRWCSEYICGRDFIYIYTIPYPSNQFILSSELIRYRNELKMETGHVFDQVTELTLYMNVQQKTNHFYFRHIQSLILKGSFIHGTDDEIWIQKQEFINSLESMINFTYLKHITLDQVSSDLSFVLLEIFRRAPQLSTLKLNPQILMMLIKDQKLCQYFNEYIKELNVSICLYPLYIGTKEMKQICSIFSNLNELNCAAKNVDEILLILKSLSKLTKLEVQLEISDIGEFLLSEVKKQSEEMKITFTIEYKNEEKEVMCFGIDRKLA
ncbi:hypothetical protein I4U23_011792 [Adineta vaga]|nr:hypothetical protein I4U23_011792 [Adineta vaga]